FLGADEAIEIKHSATSKQIFITGALRAVLFVQNQPYGSYTMKDILFA
ncbi:MAG: dihydrodipicolinate reductase C-terminal domain-containing protein, partial [Longicatena sp.]|nr:dihydrodipicolinate reductase C-terminal domain-containing protein [Longicatena sp.]